jgi:hypothetical protein
LRLTELLELGRASKLEQRKSLVENIHRLSVLNQHSLEQSDEMVRGLSMAKQIHRREDMRRVGQFDLVCLVL